MMQDRDVVTPDH